MKDKKPEGETLDKPVLDGAEEAADDSIDPRKGQEDPGPDDGERRMTTLGDNVRFRYVDAF